MEEEPAWIFTLSMPEKSWQARLKLRFYYAFYRKLKSFQYFSYAYWERIKKNS